MPMRRSTCRSPRVTFAKDDGIPASPESHRRAREWPARKRARLKRQMKISIGANGGSASRLASFDTHPSDNRLPVHNAPAGEPLHARRLPLDPYLVPRNPNRQSQYTPTCRFTHELAQDSQLGIYLPVIHLTTLSAASDPATRDKHPGASGLRGAPAETGSRRFAPRAASGVSALRVTIAVPALLRAFLFAGICWHSRRRLPSA